MDLRIAAGEVVGVLGPNGSGKSTLVRGLLGLAHVQGGSIDVFGSDRRQFKQWHRIGYVPQRETVSGGIPSTVREVVSSGRLNRLSPLRRMGSADRVAIDDAIETVGLTHKARASLATLSGGQQRRTLIARALASAPELLVLDEPTAGVDAANQQVLAETLAKLAARGTTIVLITHELGPATPVVTRTIALRAGAIVHDGPASLAPDEHDDSWHHHHGRTSPPESVLGLRDTQR